MNQNENNQSSGGNSKGMIVEQTATPRDSSLFITLFMDENI